MRIARSSRGPRTWLSETITQSQARGQSLCGTPASRCGFAGLQELHPVKTRIVDATQAGGFDFLGYWFVGFGVSFAAYLTMMREMRPDLAGLKDE